MTASSEKSIVRSKIWRAGRYALKRVILAIVNLMAPPFHAGPVDVARRWLLCRIGCRVGAGSFVSAHFFIMDGRNFSMGEKGNLGAFARIWDFSPVTIGDNLLASHGLTIVSGTHDTAPPFAGLPGPVTIGNNVWIGVNVTIVGPSRIADGAVIGANSFVTGDLLEPGVYAGSPATLKRRLAE